MSVSAASVVPPSSTLWATPSKEWVIPAKPKPGRKPKKDPQPSTSEDIEVDAKGRRVQNRAAQRAFRERKQSQLAELQTRVQQYEQGEIERNVALQAIAKRMKEENEKLLRENTLLKEKLARMEQERDALRELSRKRWLDDSSRAGSETPARKRTRVYGNDLSASPHSFIIPTPYASSPSSVASSPDSTGHTSFSPMPSLPPPRDTPLFAHGNSFSNVFDFISSGKADLFQPGGAMDAFDCGFCSENTPCVCRELAMQQMGDRSNSQMDQTMKVEASDFQVSTLQLDTSTLSPVSHQPSILDNLPAYQPPVPLRRRNVAASTNSPVFPVFSQSTEIASCTGDPSNCPACADDAFGKAFCTAVNKSVATHPSPCGDCPSNGNGVCSGSAGSRCCGNSGACSRLHENQAASTSTPTSNTVNAPSSGPLLHDSSDNNTIPCDRVWRQIKSHPNVTFADLDLLAEVVARRSKCTGPRVEICPAPGSITPERGISPFAISSQPSGTTAEPNRPVMLSNPHTQYHEAQRESVNELSLQLVPQDVLIQCGRQRVREVEMDAVRDALRLLDARFPLR